MLYQELPRIDAGPFDGAGRWLEPAVAVAAGLTAALVLLLIGAPMLAVLALLVGVGVAAMNLRRSAIPVPPSEPLVGGADYALVGSALTLTRDPVALTDGDGSMLIVNADYRQRFGSTPPLQLAASDAARSRLLNALLAEALAPAVIPEQQAAE